MMRIESKGCAQISPGLAFFPQLCYNLCSFILSRREGAAARSSWMRTNRGGPTGPQRGLPPLAARCKQPGARAAPYHRGAQRRTSAGRARYSAARGAALWGGAIRVEPWSSPARHTGASSRAGFYGMKRFFVSVQSLIERKESCHEDHLQRRHRRRVPQGRRTARSAPHRRPHHGPGHQAALPRGRLRLRPRHRERLLLRRRPRRHQADRRGPCRHRKGDAQDRQGEPAHQGLHPAPARGHQADGS